MGRSIALGRPIDFALIAAVCILVVGCSRRVASSILGLPPPQDTVELNEFDESADPAPQALMQLLLSEDTVRPAIERWLDPDTVRALLPRDHAGNIDWMAALDSGVIKPRSAISDTVAVLTGDQFEFGYDFFLPGPDTTLHAYFPHSSHTQWVDCKQCHARIFPFRNLQITMGEIFQGKYCGECHGKVAFPVTTDCERCHVNMPPMPAGRAQPELLGTFRLPRRLHNQDETPSDSTVSQREFRTASLPAAQFPHWVHRIRYRCKVCHMDIFEPRAGSNRITMQDIGAGKACGQCHNGAVAFDSGFDNCQRCHVPEDAGSATN